MLLGCAAGRLLRSCCALLLGSGKHHPPFILSYVHIYFFVWSVCRNSSSRARHAFSHNASFSFAHTTIEMNVCALFLWVCLVSASWHNSFSSLSVSLSVCPVPANIHLPIQIYDINNIHEFCELESFDQHSSRRPHKY